jgi:DNA-binding CsgD family transcriptional regulator
LLDLGILWRNQRDLVPAGDYFRRALELAHTLDDPANSALSQTYLGIWLAFMGEPGEAIALLSESLQVFEQQGNWPMVAQALWALGLAARYAGERQLSLSPFDRALTLLGASEDHWIVVVCLALRALLASPAYTETMWYLPGERSNCEQDLQEALRIATAIEWRAGQAAAHYLAGWTLASFGALGQALTHTRTALSIATELEQRHYLVAAYNSAGDVLLALLDPVQARAMLSAGLEIAHAVGAGVYLGNMTASLAHAYLLAGDLAKAEATLAPGMSPEQSPRNLHERRLAEALLASAAGEGSTTEGEEQPIPALLKLRGEALFALGRAEEAMLALEQAQRGAQDQGALLLLWPIQRALGRVYAASGHKPLAREAFSNAREVIAILSASLDDPLQRERFLEAALSTLPKERPLSARQSARHAFEGLSEREREIARLIAQGSSNREIAAALFISQRTVGTHIGHMYDKLGIDSRAQLVAWAIAKGLVTSPRAE